MTRLDRALLEIRTLRQRVEALEAAARPMGRTRREPAPKPSDDDLDERDGWWGNYLDAAMLYGGGRAPLKRGRFAIKHNLPVSEFYRFFSRDDQRGIPRDSGPYQRARDELIEAAAKLKTSHGTARPSQSFAA